MRSQEFTPTNPQNFQEITSAVYLVCIQVSSVERQAKSRNTLGEMNPKAITAPIPRVVVTTFENVTARGSGGASGSAAAAPLSTVAGAGGGGSGGCGHTFSPLIRTVDWLTASSFSSMKNCFSWPAQQKPLLYRRSFKESHVLCSCASLRKIVDLRE